MKRKITMEWAEAVPPPLIMYDEYKQLILRYRRGNPVGCCDFRTEPGNGPQIYTIAVGRLEYLWRKLTRRLNKFIDIYDTDEA